MDGMDQPGRLERFRGEDGQHYLRLVVSANGERLMTSEGHKNRVDVEHLAARYFPDLELHVDE
jgi:hypothetical protein